MSERVPRRRLRKEAGGRQLERRVSEYDRRRETEEGRLSLAAASLATQVASLIERAKERSNLSGKQLAERLGVTEGRVSQVLNGDGNVRVATLARFLGACGFELHMTARPLSGEGSVLECHSSPRPRGGRVDLTYHLFEQVYVSSAGVTSHLNSVPGGSDRPVPMGEPVYVAQDNPIGSEQRFAASLSIWNWQSFAAGAVVSEGTSHLAKAASAGESND